MTSDQSPELPRRILDLLGELELYEARGAIEGALARDVAQVGQFVRDEIRRARKIRRFPVLEGGATVPWDMLAPFEPQALANHDQSLEKLASRGGLSWTELLAVLEGKDFRLVREINEGHARQRVLALVAEYEQTGAPTR